MLNSIKWSHVAIVCLEDGLSMDSERHGDGSLLHTCGLVYLFFIVLRFRLSPLRGG